MISCSNIKSETYDGNNSRSEDNARWENIVNLDLEPGDLINLESSTIHVRGISSDSTVELTNKNNDSGMSDSKIGFRFTGYVNDNGQNTIAHPFVGADKELDYPLYNAPFPELYNLTYDPADDSNVQFTTIGFVGPSCHMTNDNEGNAPPNAGELVTTDYAFSFSYDEFQGTESMVSPFNDNLKTYYGEKASDGSWNSVSGHKYTLISEDYLGPYRKTDNPEEFWSSNIEPQYFDVKVDLNGPLYESPSTIANEINHQLNNSDPYGEANTIVRDSFNQVVNLPSLTGKVLKVRKCNGFIDYDYDVSADPNEGRKKLWGNLAVRDYYKWEGIDALMHADIAFNYQYGFKTTIRKCYQPCFLMPNGNNNGGYDYPRTSINTSFRIMDIEDLNVAVPSLQTVTKSIHYSTLPQYYIMCTNMKYNEDNLKRIQTYMRNTERYDGSRLTNEDADIGNWRSHFDIGFSHQTRTAGHSSDESASREMYYCSQGNFNLTESNPTNPTAYAYSRPYFPYADQVDDLATSRSDIPDVGYLQMCTIDENINIDGNACVGFATIKNFTNPPPQFFKNNKNKDASIAFSSKYDSSWKTKAVGDNMTFGDDALSKKYNVGAYPVTIYSNSKNVDLYDLTDTYYIGACTDVAPIIKPAFPDPDSSFVYKITAPHDFDHETHGNYSLYYYEEFSGGWVVQDDIYIYSYQHKAIKDGRDDLSGLTYNNGQAVDLDNRTDMFVVDGGNTRRWVLIIADSTHLRVYPCDNFSNDAGPDYGNLNDYNPLGAVPFEEVGYHEVWLTDMYIASSVPHSKFYVDAPGVNDQNITVIQNPDNLPEQVIGMMLYRPSATQNSDGSWTISKDFALPTLHQGMWCVSTSFMDNPAVFLTNAQRYDDKTYINDLTDTSNPQDWDFMNVNKNINYIEVGCSNPTFQWSNDLSRCTFSNLHTTKRLGIEDMPTDSNGDYVTTTIGNEVVKVADNIIKNGFLFNIVRQFQWGPPDTSGGTTSAYLANGPNVNYKLNYAIGGISFHSLWGEGATENNSSLDDMRQITSDNFTGTLLYKLGFNYTDIFPKYGLPTNLYDYSKINSTDPNERYRKLKPLTTNPLLDQSSAIDLNVKDATAKDSAGKGLPMFNLSVGSTIPVNLDGSTSDLIVASDLPIKQDTPYYLIYCNLNTGNWVENTDTFNILHSANKKFISGDFVYGEAGNPFEIKIAQKVTRISIEIRDSTGTICSLNPNSSILLKLYKNNISETT